MTPAPAGSAAGLLAFAAAALLFSPAGGPGDVMVAKDGRIFEGMKMSREPDAIVLHFANGDVRVPMDRIEDYAIEGSPLPPPGNDEEKARRDQGLVPWQGKWVPAAVRERELRKATEDRAKAIEDYKKHREWKDRYLFKTTHFEFESTLPKSQNDEFADLLETYFKEFSKVWKVTIPPKWGRLKVCFYSSSEEFHRSATNTPGVLAYYRFVEPRELDFYYDREDPAMSVACLYHEANHYLTHLLNEHFNYPHWVNEAMAEYYGASIWDPAAKTMKIGGVQQGRLAEVREETDQQKFQNLKDLISSTARSYSHYYWGWSFVHFMMETPKYRPKFIRFFTDLGTARDIKRVPMGFPGMTTIEDGRQILDTFISRMGIKEQDLEALQKEWYEHIGSMEATSVTGLETGGLSALQQGYWRFRAPRLLKEAIDKGSRKPVVWQSYSWCLVLKGTDESKAEAVKTIAKATEVDPLASSNWAVRGYITYATGAKEEGQKLVALAQEMDADADYFDPEEWIKIRTVKDSGQ